MKNEASEELSGWRRVLLATAGVATLVAPIVIGTISAPVLRAQAPVPTSASAGSGPAFEAASIKPNRSADPRTVLVPQPGGRLVATNVTGAELVRYAFSLPDFQVLGGPNWLDSDRFDVAAKAEGDPPVEQKRLMLRRLLAERFKLAVHTETRELPIYALVMARNDGRMGPNLRRTQADCAREQPSSDAGVGPAPRNSPRPCGFFGFAPGTDMPSGRGGLAFRGMTMAGVAKTILMPAVHRSVSDQTGLAGYFDADFDFTAEIPPPPPPPGLPNPWGREPFVTVFTVLPEQLGLKLDSRRGQVEVLVIDHAEQPTPDY
jgi:uncharacterized protein (TIGR03435 family)